MLKRDVQVGQHQALGHEWQDVIHMRVWVDIMQPHPDAELAEFLHQFGHVCLDGPAIHEIGAVPKIHPIGAGVLGDDQNLFHARFHEGLGLSHHLANGPGDQVAPHRWNDAEAAPMVTAFRDLQVGVVGRGEPNALLRHEIDERVVGLGQVRMDRSHDFGRGMRPGDRQDLGMHASDEVFSAGARLIAQAARHDDLAVFGQGLANGIQALLNRLIDEATGVDHDQVGLVVARRNAVALCPQLGQDALGINQCLGAPQ